MILIKEYFPNLSSRQLSQFELLESLYKEWNEKINVISRKDTEELYERHVLHSLAIAKVIKFKENSKILDVGTGGGFPGIPLAIMYPNSEFLLVDSIGKKIKVVNAIADSLDLSNLRAIHTRAEDVNEKFDFVVSRAVTQMPLFLNWVKGKFKSNSKHQLPNGILYLKGGDLTQELNPVKEDIQLFVISAFFKEDFFDTKKVVYVRMT